MPKGKKDILADMEATIELQKDNCRRVSAMASTEAVGQYGTELERLHTMQGIYFNCVAGRNV